MKMQKIVHISLYKTVFLKKDLVIMVVLFTLPTSIKFKFIIVPLQVIQDIIMD
jgi:hypothetical protein